MTSSALPCTPDAPKASQRGDYSLAGDDFVIDQGWDRYRASDHFTPAYERARGLPSYAPGESVPGDVDLQIAPDMQ